RAQGDGLDTPDGGVGVLLGRRDQVRLREPGGRPVHQAGYADAGDARPRDRRARDGGWPGPDRRLSHAPVRPALHRRDDRGHPLDQDLAVPWHVAPGPAACAPADGILGGDARVALGHCAAGLLAIPASGRARALVARRHTAVPGRAIAPEGDPAAAERGTGLVRPPPRGHTLNGRAVTARGFVVKTIVRAGVLVALAGSV